MKAELVLFMVMIISINSYPFLRKLADTAESCKNAGKDYQEGKPAQCKTGNTVFEVSAESECKVGTWDGNESGVCSGTAATPLTETTCKGTPTYSVSEKIKTPASCKAGGKDVTLVGEITQKKCEDAVKWVDNSDKKCNVEGISVSACESAQAKWIADCKIGDDILIGSMTEAECTAITVAYSDKCVITGFSSCKTEGDLLFEEGICYVSTTKITESEGCVSPSLTESNGKCVAEGQTISGQDKNSCSNYEIKLVDSGSASCTISGLDKESCKATYNAAVVETEITCKIGSTELTDKSRLKYKSACETELVWQKGKCSNEMVSNKEDCIASKEYTAAVEGKCVDKASSSNSFLAFKFALVLIACLLF